MSRKCRVFNANFKPQVVQMVKEKSLIVPRS